MNNSSSRDVEVFTEAIQLPSVERAAYLDRACGNDAELRQEVLALLQAHDSRGTFLEQSPQKAATETRLEALIDVKTGDRIGRYKLLQPIGEGGCGVVYLAEQEEPIRRRVALKVIKPGMDTKSVIARFEAERQTLALMDHPNIAKVLDAGATESGRPYFVMELVHGIKITDYCDQNSFSTGDRLKLFIQVCRAIQHAHQKGIIHRDIKPSNILVTTTPEGTALPVVIDFGIAKATTTESLTGKTLLTAFEMLVGTPAYMSPEQADLGKGDLDTRTDIYSLGVLLYEMLTGSTPFDTAELLKSGLDEVRRTIREREPVRPSTRLSKLTAADLTVIAQRHRSEPPTLIRAVRGDLDWIVMKAMEKDRRRRYETANGLAVDVQRFLDNEAISARPPNTLYKFQKLAVRNKWLFSGIGVIALVLVVSLVLVSVSLARERREAVKSRQVTQLLEDMLSSVQPSVARGRDTSMLKEILDQTTARVGQELTNQPAVEAELFNLIGTTHRRIGNFSHGEEMHRTALAIRRKVFGSESPEVAQTLNDLGLDLIAEQKQSEAEGPISEALAIRRRLFGIENLDTATSLNDLSSIYRDHGKLEEAEIMAREALAIRQKLSGKENLAVADSLRNLSIILGGEGKWVESEATIREVLAMRGKLLKPDHPWVASTLDDIAWAAGSHGKFDEATSLEETTLAIRQKVLGDAHPDVAKSLSLVGQRMQARGNLTESEALLNAAYSIQSKVVGAENSDTLETLHSLSSALEREGKWAEAEVADRAAWDASRRQIGNKSHQTLEALMGLIRVLMDQKKFGEAMQLLDAELTPEFVKQPASADLLTRRADLMGRQGRWREAAADATLACEYPTVDPFYFHMLAVLLVKLDHRPQYEQLCGQLLARFTNTVNPYVAERVVKDCLLLPDSGVDLRVLDKLADTAVVMGKGDNSGLPWFQTAKAESSYRLGKFAEAVEWAKKPSKDSPSYALAHTCAVMAMAHWQLGQKDEARAALARGDSMAPSFLPALDSVDLGESWVAWLEARIALEEASALLQPSATVPDGSKKL